MPVTVSVVGGEEFEVDAAAPTAAALCEAAGFSPHEATVLVDGRPVPDDATVDADRVELLRLVQGG